MYRLWPAAKQYANILKWFAMCITHAKWHQFKVTYQHFTSNKSLSTTYTRLIWSHSTIPSPFHHTFIYLFHSFFSRSLSLTLVVSLSACRRFFFQYKPIERTNLNFNISNKDVPLHVNCPQMLRTKSMKNGYYAY